MKPFNIIEFTIVSNQSSTCFYVAKHIMPGSLFQHREINHGRVEQYYTCKQACQVFTLQAMSAMVWFDVVPELLNMVV